MSCSNSTTSWHFFRARRLTFASGALPASALREQVAEYVLESDDFKAQLDDTETGRAWAARGCMVRWLRTWVGPL